MIFSFEDFKNFLTSPVRINTTKWDKKFALVDCDITETMSESFLIVVNMLSNDDVAARDLLDEHFLIQFDQGSVLREFSGICTRAALLGDGGSLRHYRLELRPSHWHMAYRTDTRVFTDMSPMDTVRKVFGEAGAVEFEDRTTTSESGESELIVQYNETDLNFITRLIEDEGRYYYFAFKDGHEKLIICDGADCHDPVPGQSAIKFAPANATFEIDKTYIKNVSSDWSKHATIHSTTDFDFKKINAVLRSSKEKSEEYLESAESNTYPGGYSELDEGERIVSLQLDAHRGAATRIRAETNAVELSVGQILNYNPGIGAVDKLPKGDAKDKILELLITATHIHLSNPASDAKSKTAVFQCHFEALFTERVFRTQNAATRPVIPGVQTAEVVGPGDKEIHTDEFGRVKVQFHWDRVNKKDDSSSCWIRVATPWAGQNWGAISVPRVGQEVVVQFEEGNPDRPLIVGMLFNKRNMPPQGLPGAATQMGMKSNSSPGGGGANEFVMEDKKGSEEIRMVAEKDYNATIKNDANINVGYEKNDPGNYTLNVYDSRFENVSNGDYNLGVDTGSRFTYINTDDTLEVDGSLSHKVKNTYGVEAKDVTVNGKKTLKIESPDVDINGKTKTKVGSATIEVDGNKVSVSGKAEILLSVGGSSIKLDPSGVTIAGPLVKIN